MIQQTAKGLNSRSEANPYNEDGFLPLIASPMYSVVDETNYQIFLDNKIRVCLPRNKEYVGCNKDGTFISLSLGDFKSRYITPYQNVDFFGGFQCTEFVCVDCASGNIPQLHEAIRKAKEIHGDNLVIMAGNVASVEAFVELAKTGVDYIRVGIGGGGGCNTTSNTGVGQVDLEELINSCHSIIEITKHGSQQELKYGSTYLAYGYLKGTPDEFKTISKVKIVADGISSHIKQCESKYGFNDNGYAAINKLLFAGADLVMVGKLFAQCLESAGEKGYYNKPIFAEKEIVPLSQFQESSTDYFADDKLLVKYLGMSTQKEQVKYKNNISVYVVAEGAEKTLIVDRNWLKVGEKYYYNNSEITITSGAFTNGSEYYYSVKEPITFKVGEQIRLNNKNVKPSEGSVNWIPVRWTLDEWLNGSYNQDKYPYLMGWVNSIKSAMSYTGKTKL